MLLLCLLLRLYCFLVRLNDGLNDLLVLLLVVGHARINPLSISQDKRGVVWVCEVVGVFVGQASGLCEVPLFLGVIHFEFETICNY